MRILAAILMCQLVLASAQAHDFAVPAGIDIKRLPVGDDKISKEPKVGMIWACRVDSGGGGSRRLGPWMNGDGTYDLTAKAAVGGAVTWPFRFAVSVENALRLFSSNELPNHPTGNFPVRPNDPVHRIDPNPHRITAHDVQIELPSMPVFAPQPNCAPGTVGILLTGAPLFSALDAMGRDAVAHEVQDSCQGHPQVTGVYHYHSITHCVDDKRPTGGHSALVGYALDGFGIYGHYGEDGTPLKSADLDPCHGHTHKILWDGKTVEMYHYHGTVDFPYSVGCLRGRVDMRAVRALGGGPPPNGRFAGLPNLDVAAQRLGIAPQRLKAALGPPPPDLTAAAGQLGISLDRLQAALDNAR